MGGIDLEEQTNIPVFVPACSSLAHHRAWEKPDQVVVMVQEPPPLEDWILLQLVKVRSAMYYLIYLFKF